MATRIINKLYNLFDAVEATVTSTYRGELYSQYHRIETSFEHIEPQPKRATKNLESLIKEANKHGYLASIAQGYDKDEKKLYWYAFVHGPDNGTDVAGSSHGCFDTAYQALKVALESISRRWNDQ